MMKLNYQTAQTLNRQKKTRIHNNTTFNQQFTEECTCFERDMHCPDAH